MGATHASGRAGQHFELFDSILGGVKKSPHILSVRTVCKVMPRVRYRLYNNVLLLIATVFK